MFYQVILNYVTFMLNSNKPFKKKLQSFDKRLINEERSNKKIEIWRVENKFSLDFAKYLYCLEVQKIRFQEEGSLF